MAPSMAAGGPRSSEKTSPGGISRNRLGPADLLACVRPRRGCPRAVVARLLQKRKKRPTQIRWKVVTSGILRAYCIALGVRWRHSWLRGEHARHTRKRPGGLRPPGLHCVTGSRSGLGHLTFTLAVTLTD